MLLRFSEHNKTEDVFYKYYKCSHRTLKVLSVSDFKLPNCFHNLKVARGTLHKIF